MNFKDSRYMITIQPREEAWYYYWQDRNMFDSEDVKWSHSKERQETVDKPKSQIKKGFTTIKLK